MDPSSWFSGNGDIGSEVLWEDGERLFCRRWRPCANGDRQSVLVMLPVAEHPTPGSLNRLTHEYEVKDDLDDAWAARPLELVRERGQTILMLKDPGGEPLDRLIGPRMEIKTFLRLAVALAAALGRLHKGGLVHKDIKPTNVLVNSVTGQTWLTGFGIASRLPRERQSADLPEFLAGTLAYMAPEQTGRMNRSIDSRSDLYSLGVTLYQMLTGGLPFTASDPMEWVHCHIARKPTPPSERLENVPTPVSAIIMKLLAKTAEERYQTAAGVESDLRRCLAEWETRCHIGEFPLGEHDTPDRLLIPEKLYGRASETETLLASFDRVVASGRPELVLVSGYSGIGKSSVVNELHKVLVPSRGLFASGKFEQYKRDIPYATLAQAFQSLVRSLLSKSEPELRVWRDAFQEALGPNALLIVGLVPELNLIVGEQPPVPILPPQDAQRRFQVVFRRFISVFARPEHPLALFLDDLQWLDAATLDLLEDLLTQPDVQHLMLIGAYRDNEVDSTHPLMRKLETIRKTGAAVQEIVLTPLVREDLEQLIGDTLRCEPERAAPLAQLVHEKTNGNPFFAIQFISSLADEGLLNFDHGDSRWSWELAQIHAKGYTHNVVDLMVEKLSRLAVETQNALQQLACLGNNAEFALLMMVYQETQEEMHHKLWEAVQAGLIFRSTVSYKFLHDRVQEAAYSLISKPSRTEAHLQIGRLLVTHIPPEQREKAIFDIVNQLNRGATMITSRDEREHVAELNLIAGKRAKASTAYTSALGYLIAGRALLAHDAWERRRELIFTLELDRAECEVLSGQSAAAADRLTMLSSRAANTIELAIITCLQVDLYTILDQSDRAVAVCLNYLRHVGVEWSPHPTYEDVLQEYDRIWSLLGRRAIDALTELPLMSDTASLSTMDVLTKVMSAAYFTDENLSSLVICHMVNLSLEHGNSDGSCFAYVWLAVIAGPRFNNYQDGFRFGRLGYELVEKHGLKRFQARTYMCFGNMVIPWARHVQAGRNLVRRAFDAANEIGDLTFAAYSCNHLVTNLLAAGDQLAEVQYEAEKGLEFARKLGFGLIVDDITAQLRLILSLRGLTAKFGVFNDEQFDEFHFEQHLSSGLVVAEAECWYLIRKLQARFFAGDYASALDASLRAKRLLWTSPSQFETAEFHFYSALSHAACWDPASFDRRQQHFEALANHYRQLQVWEENCPENFENRAALVGAEIARIEGRELDAERLYEQAIRSARANGFVHNEALANELASRFYKARGFDKIADTYLRDARDCYLQWGADGKVRQLDMLYPHLRDKKPLPDSTSTILTPAEHLDLATVIKLSQAISGEIVLEKLIDTLMRTAVEHAGAERGLLILARDDEHRIQAEATTSSDTVAVGPRQGSVTAADLPLSVLHYVVRKKESVLLHDAAGDKQFSADDYIQGHHARSILCVPLLKETRLVGVLYLENNLAPHVFTPDRIVVLKLLASEAAISLENIRLYDDLQDREAKIRRLVDIDIIGIFKWCADGRIIDANNAYLRIIGYDRGDLIAGRLSWRDLTPPEWRGADDLRAAQLEMSGTAQPYEKEYFRKDGSRVPVLVGATLFDGRPNEGVGFVLDLTERKRAEAEARESERRYREVQMELAHANRVATMGLLSASIAHEINQPIAAAVTYADAAMRWLGAHPPNLEEVREALGLIMESGIRAGEVMDRTRALVKKAPPHKDSLEINEVILEVIALTSREIEKNGISAQTQLAESLPAIQGDRVQLQQVILNLLINAIEAISEMSEGPRELQICTAKADPGVLVSVRDSGPGLTPESVERLFESFYTTKPGGLGMGLSICRSIIEAHGGRLWASANEPRGAVFQFTVTA
ncbi:trifunctional serine/threonine-protein kinase/ATP-binding protein/sensor histidine kinase [Bradyrhizobium erythrophlei]|uniref:histidine kinase n=1 Tax=Bradyrhizobium erythrophlei TaxID=1437360 RepID=A0A1M5P0V5_9BRAD|nr:trifunctional serine/threonine-protein kinase/ATP-binding protein/sensor histidine kinase [Bradyrhizobium erythrophlei]SHG95337.1 serine/threonine protein kinase and signal transduction histidine kinase [Bradyrhizobium erythrophlei]